MQLITKRYHRDGLVQERRNSSAIAMELRLSYNNPLSYHHHHDSSRTFSKVDLDPCIKLYPTEHFLCN